MNTRVRRWFGQDRLRVLTDVDEVLCNFQKPALAAMAKLGKTLPRDYDQWDIFQCLSAEEKAIIFAEIETPGFCSALEPLPGAIEAIKEIQTFADVYAVTSPFHSPTWVHERDAWLKEHFGLEKKNIVYTSAKYLVAGDVLIDDRPENVEKWKNYHQEGLGLLWALPHTSTYPYGPRVYSWEEVLQRLRWEARDYKPNGLHLYRSAKYQSCVEWGVPKGHPQRSGGGDWCREDSGPSRFCGGCDQRRRRGLVSRPLG